MHKTDLRGVRSFGDFYGRRHHSLVLYLGAERRRLEGIDVLPWQEGLQAMALLDDGGKLAWPSGTDFRPCRRVGGAYTGSHSKSGR